jgi:hypothetical protein
MPPRAALIDFVKTTLGRGGRQKKQQQKYADELNRLLYSCSIVALYSRYKLQKPAIYRGFKIDPTFRNDGVGCSNHPSGTIGFLSCCAKRRTPYRSILFANYLKIQIFPQHKKAHKHMPCHYLCRLNLCRQKRRAG